mgnify:CR=1 FL=1
MQKENQNLIFKSNNELSLYQRSSDGYVNATKLCQQSNKKIHDYFRTTENKDYLNELERSTGISVDVLISKVNTGLNENRGTWVHPKVAIHLAQWLSPQFAVFVTNIMMDWFSGALERRKTKEDELFALIKEDGESFERTSAAAKIMKQRQVVRPILARKIKQKQSEIQQDMFIGCYTAH